MKRSIRFTRSEYDNVLRLSEYLKIGSFFPQKFDDKENINLIINYAWKKRKNDLDLIFQNEYEKIESISKALGIFQNIFEKIRLLDMLKEQGKNENKTIILNDESEKILNELMDKYKGKTVTQIIKTILLGVLINPDYLMDIMVRFLLLQAFLFVSLDRISEKYDYKRAKNDFINMSIPKIDIKNVEIENYTYVFEKLRELKNYPSAINISKNFGINEQFFNEFVGYGLPSMLGMYEDENIPKSIKPLDIASAKFFSKSLPSMIAVKLITIATLYTALKDTKATIPGVYATTYDKIIEIFLINNKISSIAENYEMVYKSMFNAVKEWENYVSSFKDND